jgi:hypothetical protein
MTEPLLPCGECRLMQVVPHDCREEKIPCRHIPLNAEGYTIETFYRRGTQQEPQGTMADWLRETIRRLDQERGHPLARNH